MAHVHLTLEEDVLKELMLEKHPSHCTNMLGEKREEAVTKLLEQVFNAVLQAQNAVTSGRRTGMVPGPGCWPHGWVR